MAKLKTESEKTLAAIENLRARLEDLFILEACRAGIKGHEIRAILGVGMARVTRVAKYIKKQD